jgi:hypothetical protein
VRQDSWRKQEEHILSSSPGSMCQRRSILARVECSDFPSLHFSLLFCSPLTL